MGQSIRKDVHAQGIAAVLCVAIAACTGAPKETEAPLPPPEMRTFSLEGARVLYSARRSNSADLYVLDRATGTSTRLTRFDDDSTGANGGRVSPDGRRIAFQGRHGRDYDIYTMPAAGGDATNVTRHPEFDVLPVWSPDGTRIAFMSTRGYELGSIGPFPGDIYVMNADGTDLRRVTRKPLTSSLGPSDWSPDGSHLLLARMMGEQIDLFMLDVESGRETRLTTDTSEGEYFARFSHDGARIAFHAETPDSSHIVVMNLDGTGRRTITHGPGFRYYPHWSPDDAWLVFTASDDGSQYDIRAVRVEGGEEIALVATEEDEREGSWLPSAMP